VERDAEVLNDEREVQVGRLRAAGPSHTAIIGILNDAFIGTLNDAEGLPVSSEHGGRCTGVCRPGRWTGPGTGSWLT
jgi:hypothetical protein